MTGGRHRRWCSTQTRSRTGTKCPRQKHPRKLQIKSYITFTIHVCPSLSISDLESHCKTYPLTSWPCGWFSPSQFSPFCWLYTLRTQDTRSLLYSSAQSTLQCPSSSSVQQQERLPSQLRLSSASPPAGAGAGLLYNCYPLSQCSYSSNLVITIYYLLSGYWFEIVLSFYLLYCIFNDPHPMVEQIFSEVHTYIY